MLIGLGIDIIEHSRIKNMRLINDFIKKYFTENEQAIFFKNDKIKYKSIANNFAVKEAFSKALGTGIRGFLLNEVEVLRDEQGKPYITLYGKAKSVFESINGKNIFVSISDTDVISSAVVVIEG